MREVKEETDLDMTILKPIKIWSGTKGTMWRVSIEYLCRCLGGSVKLSKEHDDYVWASLDAFDRMNVEKWVKESAILTKQETAGKDNLNN